MGLQSFHMQAGNIGPERVGHCRGQRVLGTVGPPGAHILSKVQPRLGIQAQCGQIFTFLKREVRISDYNVKSPNFQMLATNF